MLKKSPFSHTKKLMLTLHPYYPVGLSIQLLLKLHLHLSIKPRGQLQVKTISLLPYQEVNTYIASILSC